jgi:peptidoglycan/xylan/chitin deacetylase (PgdA/CDA1 family)
MEQGSFCISIDLELAWGNWDSLSPEYLQKCLSLERQIANRLLRLFERYEVCATWAIVGQLLEESSMSSLPEAPAWFAPDIVDLIMRINPRQEIASHSFKHIYFTDVDENAILADLRAAQATHRKHGLDFTSFVFPRNKVCHIELLAQAGLKVFRSVDRGWHMSAARLGGRIGRLANLADKMLPLAPSVVMPIIHPSGMVELPSSMLFLARNGIRRLIHPSVLEYKAKRGLHLAARDHQLFHLWFHPANFYYEEDGQFTAFENIVKEAALLRDRGRLEISPMGSFRDA